MCRREERGFSLIEIIIVISIILVLAGIAVPNFGPALRRYEMESSARQMGALMVRARAEAMRLNRRVCTGSAIVNGEQRYVLDLATADVDGDPCNNPTTTFDTLVGTARDSYIVLPRGVVIFPLLFPFPGLPPGYTTVPLGSASPLPSDRVVFSPRGTVEVWNGASYSMQQRVQGMVYYRLIPSSGEWDIVQVTVTPYGKTKVFRYGLTPAGWRYSEL